MFQHVHGPVFLMLLLLIPIGIPEPVQFWPTFSTPACVRDWIGSRKSLPADGQFFALTKMPRPPFISPPHNSGVNRAQLAVFRSTSNQLDERGTKPAVLRDEWELGRVCCSGKGTRPWPMLWPTSRPMAGANKQSANSKQTTNKGFGKGGDVQKNWTAWAVT